MSNRKAYVKYILIAACLVFFVAITVSLIDYGTKERSYYQLSDKDYFEKPSVVEELTTVGKFKLSDYTEYIELSPSEQKVEPIKDRLDAKNKGKTLIMEAFGTLNGKPYDPLKHTSLATYYDADTECWLVKGLYHPELTGVTPGVIIRQNGEVLAIFYS